MKPTWIRMCLAGMLALACGSDPEADLEEASRALEAAQLRVERARAAVEVRQGEIRTAQQRLEEARSALREAERDLAKRAQAVDRSATDEVLFRTVQKRLLEDGDLSGVAIAARVEKGAVTLSGRVPNEKLRDRAVEIAKTTPGVERVESRIEVPIAAPKKAGE